MQGDRRVARRWQGAWHSHGARRPESHCRCRWEPRAHAWESSQAERPAKIVIVGNLSHHSHLLGAGADRGHTLTLASPRRSTMAHVELIEKANRLIPRLALR